MLLRCCCGIALLSLLRLFRRRAGRGARAAAARRAGARLGRRLGRLIARARRRARAGARRRGARAAGGLARLRRMAGQLRASGVRGGRRRLRRAGPVVRPAPAPGDADPAHPPPTRPPAQVTRAHPTQYLSNRSALAPDPADADIDDLRPWVEDQATDGRRQFARAQRPSPAAGEPL